MYSGYTWSWVLWELAKQIAPSVLAVVATVALLYGLGGLWTQTLRAPAS
jgi:hypothetical protein